jgi:hypothetical protein
LLRGVLNRFTVDRIIKALTHLDAGAHVRIIIEQDEAGAALA